MNDHSNVSLNVRIRLFNGNLDYSFSIIPRELQMFVYDMFT